jgi:5'-deoxynucleotidase YfbR-like HD superfamily hydrolase
MTPDIFINIQETENELKQMLKIAETFETKFSLISQQVAYIFSKIEECETLENAAFYFECLDKIKTGLTCLLYKYNIGMPERLIRFVQYFDNLEPMNKEYYFKKITSGEYLF